MFINFLENVLKVLNFASAENSLNSSTVVLNLLKRKLLNTISEFSRFSFITVLFNPLSLSNPCYCFVWLAMSVWFFHLIPESEYLNLLTVAAFPNSSYFGKTSSPVKNAYLPTFPDDKD